MKRILIAALTSALLASGITPTSAVEYPLPTWAAETGAPTGFTWTNWFPCSDEFKTTDCIDSVYWVKSDGTRVLGKWVTKPGASYATAQLRMNYTTGDFGYYTFDGLTTPCSDNAIVVDVRPMRHSFDLYASPTCHWIFKEKFEERFEITVKSKSLKGFVGGVASNGKDPEISFTESGGEQFFTLRLNFAYFSWESPPAPGQVSGICEKNEYKATDGGWAFWSRVFWIKQMRDPFLAINPGDMIAASNGVRCVGKIEWDSQEQALVILVGSPHFDVDGSVVEGWYEGAIRGRYITSRFGIKPEEAAGSARLEIVYTDGQRKVATITAKYDSATDWLYLKGYGFTYSTPKLMVKFGKPIATVTVKKTITCVKGKTSKKVTAVKPACPKGYKKKS